MKGWNKIVVVFAVLLAAFLCKNLFAGQGDAEKLSKTVSIEKSVTMGGVEAGNPTINPEQVSVDKPTKEALIQKTRTLQMPFIANNGQMDEQVRFYAKTFGGTVFVTKDGEIVYALPEGRDVPAGASQEAGRGMKHGGSGAGEQGSGGAGALSSSGAAGWHGQEPLVHADVEFVATNAYLPLFRADNTNCPPGRVLANTLISAYLPGLQKETTQRVVSTPATSNQGVLPANGTPHFALPTPNSKPPNLNSSLQTPHSKLSSVVLKEHLVGGKVGGITGEQPAVTTVNYFTGNDKSKWKTNVPTYNRVNLGEVYQGIELSLKAYGDNVEKLFCVKPGASPECIKVQLDGSKSLRVNREGQLEVETELGPVKFTRPIAYQEIDGKRVDVAVEYLIHGSENEGTEARGAGEKRKTPNSSTPNSPTPQLTYRFTVASYDRTKDLIIDPLLASTFLGGGDWDVGNSIALDTGGNVYVIGKTVSTNFPTTIGAYDTSFNGRYYHDVFVSKLNSGLTSLLASTYLGGSNDESGNALTLDASGNVYVTGRTDSRNFPTTSGAYDTSFNGSHDVFVSKLDGGLTSLLASTFLGGFDWDEGYSLTLETSGNVYVTGATGSFNFPVTSGACDTSFNGWSDVFVSKLDSGLTSLLASTYLGGFSDDYGRSLTLDASGNVYVAGSAESSNFPTTIGAYDTSFNGYYDVFASKLDSGLTSLLASTFMGGPSYDGGYSLTLDTSGNVYVTGYTYSSNFPTTSGAYDTFYAGNGDVFVSKLDGGLTSLVASTYLGGFSDDYGYSLALDVSGNVYVTGCTYSSNFPTTRGAYDTSFNGVSFDTDVFVSKLNNGLTSLLASTYLGGSYWDQGYSLALDPSGNIYVTGWVYSTNFPTTSGAYDTSFNGGYWDVFISKLDGNLSATVECEAESITASHNKLTLGKGKNSDVTITVTGAGECPVEGEAVTVTINGKGKWHIDVSPSSQETDANGQAVFSISAKDKKGTAVLKFKASGLDEVATVQVKVR